MSFCSSHLDYSVLFLGVLVSSLLCRQEVSFPAGMPTPPKQVTHAACWLAENHADTPANFPARMQLEVEESPLTHEGGTCTIPAREVEDATGNLGQKLSLSPHAQWARLERLPRDRV